MRSVKFFLFLLIFYGVVFGQTISVNLTPSRSNYNVGDPLTISWTYTGMSFPSSAMVKITLWREGSAQNICLIKDNVSITQGSETWQIPATCTNPHTGAIEDLTQGRLWIRVRWQGHRPAVYGESQHFTITSTSSFSITHLRILPSQRHYSPLQPVNVRWNYEGQGGATARVRLYVKEGNSRLCEISNIIYASEEHFDWHIGEGCVDEGGREVNLPRNRDLKLEAECRGMIIESFSFRILEIPLSLSASLMKVGKTEKSLVRREGSTSTTPDVVSVYEADYEAKDFGKYQIVARVRIRNNSTGDISGTLYCRPSQDAWCREKPFSVIGNGTRRVDIPMEAYLYNPHLYCGRTAKFSWTISARDNRRRRVANNLIIKVRVKVPQSLCSRARVVATAKSPKGYLKYLQGYIENGVNVFKFKIVGEDVEDLPSTEPVFLPTVYVLTETDIWNRVEEKACLVFDGGHSRNFSGIRKQPANPVAGDPDASRLVTYEREGYKDSGIFKFSLSKREWSNKIGKTTELYYYAFIAPMDVRCRNAYENVKLRSSNLVKLLIKIEYWVPSKMTGGWR